MDLSTKTGKNLETFRRGLAIVSVLVTLYYLYWRITETFNPNSLLFSWSLYTAEVFGAITTFLFFFMTWNPIKRIPPQVIDGRTVDVFVPTKSEPVHLLRKTLLACNDLKYPHRTLVLDDGGRAEVKALAEELGMVYLARKSNEGGKAGNLNYGLKHSTAEFIAVFDADHIPLPNFIDRIIGYFHDERVGFVQTPQEFYNTDSFQHRTDKKRKYIWGEQYLFFSVIQPGKDYWNAAYFVGSCAILRRKALDEVHGFATGTITEDLLTSVRVHAKGWQSIYHNENLAYGIAAETIMPFHIQRQRWGVGNWQIFFKANPLVLRGLSFPQRICYLASMIYPLEGFQKLIFYATPPIALFTGVLPMKSLDVNYLIHFAPYFIISMVAFNEMARGYGGHLMLEQFSMGKYFTYIKSVLLFLFPKFRKTFKVTPKADNSLVPYKFIVPQFVVLAASLIAVLYAVIELLVGQTRDNFIVAVNCFWAIYNSGLAMAIIEYDYKKILQRRTNFRIPDAIPCYYTIKPANGDTPRRYLAVANNMTAEGASLVLMGQIPMRMEIDLEFIFPKRAAQMKGKVVQQRSVAAKETPVSYIGVKFDTSSQETRDFVNRYLYGFAVTKFMKEHSTRYKTYLEKRFRSDQHFKERAYRALTYIPVAVRSEGNRDAYGVIRDISETGMLLSSWIRQPQGSQLITKVLLGREVIELKGVVVRELASSTEDFEEHMVGVKFSEEYGTAIGRILDIADGIGDLVA